MADEQPDARDFTEKYNTSLAPADEAKFQGWMKAETKAAGDRGEKRNVAKDLYDYDLRGWWKANPNTGLNNGHLTDTYKKPNHPTFSTGSQYHGTNGMQGGVWQQSPDKTWSFTPGKTNMFSANELGDYFNKVEPGNKLIVPAQQQK